MARLPEVGGDEGNWGVILNDFLTQAHNDDGSLKNASGLLFTDFIEDPLVTDGSVDYAAALQSAINQASSLYTQDGLTRSVYVPMGKFRIDTPLTPPDGGGFGIIGAGIDQTIFIAPVDLPFLYNATNPDPWTGSPDFSDMVFRDFTIDGARHASQDYSSSQKGIFIQRISNTEFANIKIKDINATGFGLDYCQNVSFINCIADGCGKGRRSEASSARIGSGAGIGIGIGGFPEESVTIMNCVCINNATSGIFIEHLARTDGLYDSVGSKIIGNYCVNNNIGIADQGGLGALIQGNICRENEFAGFRLGVSSASQQGGFDGQFLGNTLSKNGTGVMIIGSAFGGYAIANNSVIDNTSYGIYFPTTVSAGWIGLGNGLVITRNRILRNGGSGIGALTTAVLPDIEISDNYVSSNGLDALSAYRDGITLVSPLGRARILRNRITANFGKALALRGTVTSLSPRIMNNDFDGSPGGTYLQEHTIADSTLISGNLGNSTTTVTNAITIPTPKTVITGWSGASTTRTRIEGGFLGNGAVQGVATGSSARVTSPTVAVTAGQIWTGSIYVKVAAGKKIQSTLVAGSTYIVGPIYRTTGDWQRISLTAAVPAGATTLRVGVIGASFSVGDVIEADAAMLTVGTDLWPYIDGAQLNCTWSGTAYNSSSVFTLPS